MTEAPRRRRADKWAAILIPLIAAILMGSYGYTYLETGGIEARLARIENTLTRVLCKIDPGECLRGGPR